MIVGDAVLATLYEETKPARFSIDTAGGGEQISIRPQRPLFIVAFMLFWLGGWTVGGWTAATTLMTKGFQPFLLFWLGAWFCGEVYVATTLCWLLFGRETLRVSNSDLEIGFDILGFARHKVF